MPRLAGQREGYLFRAFKDYQAGVRVGTQAAMAEAVRGLGDATSPTSPTTSPASGPKPGASPHVSLVG